ncbi:hypothetical protein EUGRSUZ_F00824 [Eucalyptus grandis]|uniref:Uncharacterized protein n=2 Tax=Eucalyptus grandis TaxID=71139 RepID=A0ACC3KCU4_EUCGR|nr:hypothetical protein EUGRSUZ_F00824 [Eucalyptus grandis]
MKKILRSFICEMQNNQVEVKMREKESPDKVFLKIEICTYLDWGGGGYCLREEKGEVDNCGQESSIIC